MEEESLPEQVIIEIIAIVVMERLNDLSEQDIYWEIAYILENHGIRMQAEKAYEITKKYSSFLP